MTELGLRPLDPSDAAAFDAFYDVYSAAVTAVGPDVSSPWMREELRAIFLGSTTGSWTGGFVGSVDGEVVVAGRLRTRLLDNRESAEVDVHVDPRFHRRGFGSQMLDLLVAEAAGRGRRILNAEASWAYDVGPDGAGEAGPEFARAHGFTLGLSDVKRRVGLPVADERLDRLAAEAAPHHPAYALRSWIGPVPDDLADGWIRLESTLTTEAPTGGLELEAETADVALLREAEAVTAAQGRTKFNTVALDGRGEVVAYSDLVTTVHEPGRVYQWGTLVRRDARGHRLGLAVKVANLRLLQRESPGLRELITYNAEVNGHMIAVNERLGFVPVARLGEFQRRG